MAVSGECDLFRRRGSLAWRTLSTRIYNSLEYATQARHSRCSATAARNPSLFRKQASKEFQPQMLPGSRPGQAPMHADDTEQTYKSWAMRWISRRGLPKFSSRQRCRPVAFRQLRHWAVCALSSAYLECAADDAPRQPVHLDIICVHLRASAAKRFLRCFMRSKRPKPTSPARRTPPSPPHSAPRRTRAPRLPAATARPARQDSRRQCSTPSSRASPASAPRPRR
jgi:hypothetical protein